MMYLKGASVPELLTYKLAKKNPRFELRRATQLAPASQSIVTLGSQSLGKMKSDVLNSTAIKINAFVVAAQVTGHWP